MPKAYNPKAVNPKISGRFQPGPEPVSKAREKHREEFIQWFIRGFPEAQRRPHPSYKEIAVALERGEGHTMGHYASEMMYDMYPGMEDELMDGAWDTHGHVFPDYVPRRIDIIDYAIEASKAKMGGIVCKDHFFTTVGQAWAAQWVVDEMKRKGELEYACKVLGTHILAWSTHPDQIHLISKYPNLGAVFFNTWTGAEPTPMGAVHACGGPIHLIDNKENLMPEVAECIRLCAEYKIPIMTGHRVYVENLAICQEAQKCGAHVLITHAEHMTGTIKQTKELAAMGAQIEINAAHGMPSLIMPTADPNYMPELIEAVGPGHCHINTDFGQPIAMDPVDGYRLFIRMLMHWGFKKEDIRTMVHTNPEKFLYLQD